MRTASDSPWTRLQGPIVAIAFLSLIVGLGKLRAGRRTVYEPAPSAATLAAAPFRFRESGRAIGLVAQHRFYFPNPDAKSYLPLMSIPPSISVVDLDEDGFYDVYFVQPHVEQPNLFFHNEHGRFIEQGRALGLDDQPKTQPGSMAFFADFNRDGHTDVMLARMGCHTYLEWKDGRFVPSPTFERYCSNPKMVNVVDFDRDGWLDVVFGNYYPDVDLRTYLPLSHVFGQSGVRSGGRAEILFGGEAGFHHPPDGRFAKLHDLQAHTTSIGIHDFDDDGWPDLFLSDDYYYDALFRNLGGRDVANVTSLIPYVEHGFSGMNSDWADFDNSGVMSLFVTNMFVPPFSTNQNLLWKKEGAGFVNVARDVGVGRCGWAWGAKFADFDNDGTLDLFVINGKARGLDVHDASQATKSFSFVRNTLASTPPALRYDLALYPDFNRFVQSGFERSCMFWNQGGHFSDVTSTTGIDDLEEGQALALIDYDNDGRVDLLVGNNGGPLLVYHNESPRTGHWIGLDVKGPALARDALGARVTLVTSSGKRLVREKNPGNGYRGQNDPRLHFGIGDDLGPVTAEVTWPDGRRERYSGLSIDRYVTLPYGTGER